MRKPIMQRTFTDLSFYVETGTEIFGDFNGGKVNLARIHLIIIYVSFDFVEPLYFAVGLGKTHGFEEG